MVRTLVSILLVLLFSATSIAQQKQVRIELQTGKILKGEFKDADDVSVLLVVPEGELRIKRSDIISIEEIVPVKPAKTETIRPPVAGSEPEVGQPGWSLTTIPGAGEVVRSKGAVPAPPRGAAQPVPLTPTQQSVQRSEIPIQGTDARVGRLMDRYLWIVPQSRGNRISLGAVIFLMLVLIVQLSSRMANLEARSLIRSGLFAAFLFVILAIELGTAPSELPFILGLAGVNLVFWYLLASLLFSAGAYGSTVMLVCFTLSSLVGVLCLEVMGYVLQEGALT